jgi:hypothetical protein
VRRYRELAEIDTETWHRCPPDSFYWYINGHHEVTYITEPPFPFERRRRQATSYVELHSW